METMVPRPEGVALCVFTLTSLFTLVLVSLSFQVHETLPVAWYSTLLYRGDFPYLQCLVLQSSDWLVGMESAVG